MGAAALLISMQVSAIAQVASAATEERPQPESPAELARPLLSYVAEPELPPIQPLLPEPVDPIRLVLRLNERRVYVYQGDKVQRSYPVAIGRAGWETPTGTFQVMNMLQNPGWTNPLTGERMPPGPDNPLGERWIAFWTDGRNYIGFHGTPNRNSVGRPASHGCVRMYNEDVRQLFEIVQVGTPVIVQR
jgi:lipoprotein-anchoring transpeptidase ErfK/SrfK